MIGLHRVWTLIYIREIQEKLLMKSILPKINTPAPSKSYWILREARTSTSWSLFTPIQTRRVWVSVCVCGGGVDIQRCLLPSLSWLWIWPLAMAGAPEVKICFPWGCVKGNGSTSHIIEVFPKQLLQLGECGRLSFPSISSRKKTARDRGWSA